MARLFDSMADESLAQNVFHACLSRGRGRLWSSKELLGFFEMALRTKSGDAVRECVHILRRMAWSSEGPAEPQGQEHRRRKNLAPCGYTLRRLFLASDAALMLATRERYSGGGAPRYVLADSSPQGGRDWLLSKSSIIDVDTDLIQLFSAAKQLALVAARNRTESTESYDIDDVDVDVDSGNEDADADDYLKLFV